VERKLLLEGEVEVWGKEERRDYTGHAPENLESAEHVRLSDTALAILQHCSQNLQTLGHIH